MKIFRTFGVAILGLSVVWACGFDNSLREYLRAQFWLPFAKSGRHFGSEKVPRASTPFAGMEKAAGEAPLAKLRGAYQEIARGGFDSNKLQAALAAARLQQPLTLREREEIRLIDAKIDLRTGSKELPEFRESAKRKLTEFLRTAQTPEYLSEARGWLAHLYFVTGDQTAAGKIYIDELNRRDSNLSLGTLFSSLSMTYDYDGGPELVGHLDEYFDTPEHAAFAIQLVTNPQWSRYYGPPDDEPKPVVTAAPPYERIKRLLDRHRDLLHSKKGADTLALLGMRTALRAGDPPAALRIAAEVPSGSATRSDPDFNWMLGSAHFL